MRVLLKIFRSPLSGREVDRLGWPDRKRFVSVQRRGGVRIDFLDDPVLPPGGDCPELLCREFFDGDRHAGKGLFEYDALLMDVRQ